MKDNIIIFGSSRSDGNTYSATKLIIDAINKIDTVDKSSVNEITSNKPASSKDVLNEDASSKDKLIEDNLIDLKNYDISDFDYEYKNKNDDFMKILTQALQYKTIILATPIYWYSMSAIMKRFVDRISDLLSEDKDTGRLLRNKNLAIITSYSINPEGKDGFEPVFINTANYLGMNYLGCYFHYAGDDEKIINKNPELMKNFIEGLK
jgi:multimeric flavodoxin WrbA